MCGIAGVIDRRAPQSARPVVAAMLEAMAHRGPDGEGIWSSEASPSVVLGHRRLAILDLSPAGAQPMRSHDGRLVLTYNGEIYNYLEVRAELQKLGVAFATGSDSEVLLEAYAQWGSDCVSRFNGMFAFAILDTARNLLFCARDRYGEKPFLFHRTDDLFAFASEYKGLLQHPRIALDVDELRLLRAAHNASTGLDADRETVFTAVQQLLPGEAMEVGLANFDLSIWRYWQVQPGTLREVPDEAAEREVFDEFRELLIDAVRLRLRSDVPVGSCLSGGLDSSAIVCIVRRLLGDGAPYDTFTGHFPGTPADEWRYAEQVVTATQVRSHRTDPAVERFLDALPRFVWDNELPVGSSSQFAQWCVFGLAREQGVTVLLDGQGADETLGGYEQYFAYYLQALGERGEVARATRERAGILERYPKALVPPVRALRDRLPFRTRHWLSNRFGMGSNLLFGLAPDLAARIAAQNALPRKAGFNALANMLEQDSFGRYLTTLLRYGDRNSMAHSREVRLPFCDHRLAEFVFSLPPQLIMGEVQTKRLLRESMRGILPEPIRTRWNKQGFRPPQDLWFTSPQLRERVRAVFASPQFTGHPHWKPQWWQRALTRVKAGELQLGWTLWHPFMIEQWREHFLEPLRRARAQAG